MDSHTTNALLEIISKTVAAENTCANIVSHADDLVKRDNYNAASEVFLRGRLTDLIGHMQEALAALPKGE